MEMMREEAGYSLPIGEPYQLHALAKTLEAEPEQIDEFLRDCVDVYRLFSRENGSLWSDSLKRRMQKLDNKRKKLSEAGKRGAEIRWQDRDGEATPKPSDSHPIASDGKVKESKEEESKEIQEVWDFYLSTFDGIYNARKLTKTRKAHIRRRLKSFSLAEIKKAVFNIRKSDWHIGKNPNGKFYATPEFIFKNDEKIEEWLNADGEQPSEYADLTHLLREE